MANLQEFIDRVKAAERQYLVLATAVPRYQAAVEAATVQPPRGTSRRDVVAAGEELEATYIVRMWSAFETALRCYRRSKGADPGIRAVDLVGWTGGVRHGRAIAEEVSDGVHEVRRYRNLLVHEDEGVEAAGTPVVPVSIAESRSRLSTFLARLPAFW